MNRSGLLLRHGRVEPVYQAIWADNTSFDQVLISKRMVEDHMPDKVLEALSKVCKDFWASHQHQLGGTFFHP
eukprot:maker-scaffold139_size317827-snap-gene-2.31 protein:Tk05030 transcript:maker-scaffold139_size317827-snap-gene-2.31-mRNA-1 annotation:"inactivation no afterpotential e"